jgi:hypothetical protein
MLGCIETSCEFSMKPLLLILLLLGCGWAFADADPRIAQLETAYNRVHQEQVTIFQQFQMTQEMRRKELEQDAPNITRSYTTMGMDNASTLDYDENIRLQQARQQRLLRYDREINQAYVRYLELGDRKKALLEQILALPLPSRR